MTEFRDSALKRVSVTPSSPLPVTTEGQPDDRWNYAPPANGIVSGSQSVTVKAAVAGKRNYMSAITIDWTALGAATEIVIKDGSGSVILWRSTIGTAEGRRQVLFPTPLRTSVNTIFQVSALTTITSGNIYVNAQGYTQ